MTKRKARNINELYSHTKPVEQQQPVITPVLRGNIRFQGPTDDKDCTGKKMNSYQLGKRFSRRAVSGKTVKKEEAGTCNVCAAPCSSCCHLKKTVFSLEMKAENEVSDEVSRAASPSRSSFDDASAMPSASKRARTVKEPEASETSNFSASSTHDQLSENAESKASLGTNLLSGGLAREQNIHVSSDCDVAYDAGQRTVTNQHENGSNSDDVSCVSGVNDTHTSPRDLEVDADRKNILCSTASVSSFCLNNFRKMGQVQPDPEGSSGGQFGMKTSRDISAGAGIFLEEPEQNDSLINASNNLLQQADNMQQVDSSSEKLEKNTIPQKSNTHESGNVANKSSHMISSYGTSAEDNRCLGAGAAVGAEKVASGSVEHLETNEQIEQPSIPPEVANSEDPPSQSQPIDESDESDIVEDDVKICDICGDAGREDLLAICSRCSDGAEHTYCMRVPMKKVPEGDWLCEVCHLKEAAANQKKDKPDNVSAAVKAAILNENVKRSVATLDSKVSAKSDAHFSDEEANRFTKVAPSPRVSSKRNSDNLEGPAAKRQAFESTSGSPKPSSPNKTSMLSRERSFKILDKGKVKPAHPVPSPGGSFSHNTARLPTMAVQNSSKMHPPLQSPRGHLLKSNSFNASNLKPKVKLAHEDIIQKNKLGGHSSTSGLRKEGLVRTISKSPSFPPSSSHSVSVESKAKMSSSSLSRPEELREIKVGKDPNIAESRNSFKSDRLVSPTIGSSVSCLKDEQTVSSRGESVPLPFSAAKICDTGSIQADARLNSSLKSTAGRGDLKRLSSFVTRVSGFSSLNGNNAEQKPSQVNRVDDFTTKLSCTVDASTSVSNLVPLGLPHSQEPVEQEKKAEEPSFITSRQSVPVAGRSIRCNKCKEIGHAAQFCPNGSMRVLVREPTAIRNSGVSPAEAIDLNAVVSLEGDEFTHSLSDLQNQEVSVALSSRHSPIPESDYIWQGRFDVRRSERSMDSFDGFQAHLSTCASQKVLEVANKLPHNVTLEEVSRSSTWPKQFQIWATEDNIALYFFAKDSESYHKSYQSLVDKMIKNDMALKGILNGVELLIFPSNQLAEKSKRWNTFSYLWGVFRAKRNNLEKPGVSLNPSAAQKSLAEVSTTRLHADIEGNGTSMSGHEHPKIKEETELGQCNQEVQENISPTEGKPLPLEDSNSRQAVLPSPSLQEQEARSSLPKPYAEETFSISHDRATVPEAEITTERYFFPVEPPPMKDSGGASSSIPVHVISSDDEEHIERGRFDLNLALGEEEEEEEEKVPVPLFESLRWSENNHGKFSEEDASLGELSLSLAVPASSSAVQIDKPVAIPKPQKNKDTSFILFGGLHDRDSVL